MLKKITVELYIRVVNYLLDYKKMLGNTMFWSKYKINNDKRFKCEQH